MAGPQRRYFGELMLVIAAYAVALIVSNVLLRIFPESGLRVPLALLPMIPACAIPFVIVRLLARIDELQRRIQLEALGFAFAGTAVLTFAYGFLETAGFPRLSWFFIWPLMAGLWGAGCLWANRRYR
ncbi:MAG TPA: hypothetical protein VGE07_00230 [Herpetosiphonaceae bacterium]